MKTTVLKISESNLNPEISLPSGMDSVAIVLGPQNSFFTKLSKNLKEKKPDLKIIGLGSTQSFINNETLGSEMSLTVLSLEKTKIETFVLPNKDYDSSFQTGLELKELLKEKESKNGKLCGVLVFAEGLNINGAALVRGFEDLTVPVCGGLAAEVDFKFEKTHIFYEDRELSSHVAVIGFYGDSFSMESLNTTGMKAVGVDKKITKSNKNVLIEVDGKPALDWYRSLLKEKSEKSENALSYPVAIMKDSTQMLGAVRTPIGFNEEEKSITFTGEIPTGYFLKLMMANPYDLIEKADELVNENDGEFSLYFSCSARKLFLGNLTDLEYQKAKNCVGAYVYGEISNVDGKPTLHNQTFTVVKLKEDISC